MKKKAFISISALVGALLLALIAGMTPFVAERDLAYAQTDSDVATLRSLSVTPGTLIPVFDAAKLALDVNDEVTDGAMEATAHVYETSVRNGINSLTVSAATTDSRASVQYKVGSEDYSNDRSIDLNVGLTDILVRVTAENGLAIKHYRINVNQAPSGASDDATLSALTVTPGMSASDMDADPPNATKLGEEFEYSVDLPYGADADGDADGSQVTVVVTPSEAADAVVTVKKGTKVISETDTPDNYSVTIDVGDNTVTVDVLAPDFATMKTYTLTINRARVNASRDARLSSLSLSDGMLIPAFDPAKLPGNDTAGTTSNNPYLYTVSVPHSIFEVTVRAVTMDRRAKWEVTTPVDSDTNRSGYQVDVSDTTGTPTAITIVVTAEDRLPANQKYYRVAVTRATVSASDDATLMTLTVDPGMMTSPNATKLGEEFEYSVDLPYGADADGAADGSQVTVVVTPSEAADAVVTVKKGTKVISETATPDNYSVTIDVGDNTVTVDVLAPDFATMKTYTLTINRARANASDDARLSSLSLSRGMLMPAFDVADLAAGADANEPAGTSTNPHVYEVSVPNSVESLTVMAEAMNSGAMVEITSDGAVDLEVGPNGIDITVTAENRTEMKHYQVTVTRAAVVASTDATLSALTVDSSDSGDPEAFMDLAEKFAHSLDLPYGFDDQDDTDADAAPGSQVTVVVTPSESTAVVTVKKGDEVISEATPDNYSVTIDVGDNTITVDVLAPDFVATKTYTLTINRAGRNTSDDARLSSLSLSDGTLMPTFDPADLAAGADANEPAGTSTNPHAYEVRVPNSVESLTVMAEAMNSSAMVSIKSSRDSSVSGGAVDLVAGAANTNVITITVTAENRTEASKKYYQVSVTRVAATASSNATLGNLSLEMPTVTLDPAFDTANLPALRGGAHHFTASASRGSSDIWVFPMIEANSPKTITVMSNTDAEVEPQSGDDEGKYKVDLEVGDNVITVMVTAENVIATKTYIITINRAGTGNAALSDLDLSDVPLNEAFGTAADDAYTAGVANSVDITTVMATAVQSNATVSIMPVDADSAMDGHQVALTTGDNTITVTVTAGDNTRVYTVTVTVAPPVEGELFDRYDTNDNMQIDKSEALAAIDDYLTHGTLTKAQVLEIIDLYLLG